MARALRIALTAAAAGLGGGERAEPAAAQRGAVRLDDLAAGWSGGRGAPACHAWPGEAHLPPARRSEDCAWPRVVQGRSSGAVTGTRGPDGTWQALTWQRTVADRRAAGRLADSLGAALRGRGLAEVRCPQGQRRWQAAGVAVHFTTGAVHADGLLRVAVFATTLPGALPEMLCPGAPPFQPAPPGPPAGRRTAEQGAAAVRPN